MDFSTVEERFKITLDGVFQLQSFNQCLTQEGIDHYNQIRGGQGKATSVKEQGINEAINLHAQQIQNRAEQAEGKIELSQQAKTTRSCKLENSTNRSPAFAISFPFVCKPPKTIASCVSKSIKTKQFLLL